MATTETSATVEEQSFETCINHGYEYGGDADKHKEGNPICTSWDIRKLGLFNVTVLCAHGGFASRLEDTKYCALCRFYQKK